MWTESVHVGEVGGNNLGLYGAFPTADCALIVSHGFQVLTLMLILAFLTILYILYYIIRVYLISHKK